MVSGVGGVPALISRRATAASRVLNALCMRGKKLIRSATIPRPMSASATARVSVNMSVVIR